MPEATRKLLSNAEEGRRELANRSLHHFIRQMWPILEPGRQFVDNWHLGAMCEHLEAVARGEIGNLLINVPPGTMKSLLVSVGFPAWLWGPQNLPHTRIISASYSAHLSLRDARKSRMVIEDRWYQDRWGDRASISQGGDGYYHTEKTGFRLATSTKGVGTGERGDYFIIDDPHNVKDGDSDGVRDTTINWFKETVPTRVVDIQKSHFLCIMQRVHDRDVSGIILSEKMDYEHLCLPMRYEGKSCVTVLGIQDPRTVEGELLDPVRYPLDALDKLESKMGAYAVAGQMQQRPAPRGGGVIKRGWFEIVDAAPAGGKCVRSWDLAGTEKDVTSPDPDWTVGLKMRKSPSGFYYIEDVQRERLEALGVEDLMKNTATQDGRPVVITLPQDPGAAGKAQAQGYVRKLATFIAKIVIPSGDKVTRSAAFAAQAQAGNVKLVKGPWNEAFLSEMASFPTGAHDDQVDAAADAFNELVLGNTFDPDKWKALGK